MNKATKQTNTKKLVSLVQEHCAAVLSDIYKIEKYDITKSPFSKPENGKHEWIVNIEAVHSEFPAIMVMFSFRLTEAEVAAILAKNSTRTLFRTGRE